MSKARLMLDLVEVLKDSPRLEIAVGERRLIGVIDEHTEDSVTIAITAGPDRGQKEVIEYNRLDDIRPVLYPGKEHHSSR